MDKRMILVVAATLIASSMAQAGVREDWQAVADAVAATGNTADAMRLEAAVDAMSNDELESFYGSADLNQLAENFRAVGQAVDAAEIAFSEQGYVARGTIGQSSSADFPEAEGYPTSYLCPLGDGRSSADLTVIAVDAVRIARQAFNSAQIAWSGLSRECEQTVLGQNTSIACIPVDLVLYTADLLVGVAEGWVENVTFCDSAVDSAEIEGSYERLDHIHTDLEIHDGDIKAQLATHDADIKALLSDIQATVDENQRLIKISASRQLEIMRLLITPGGQRDLNSNVLTCTGDDCPDVDEVITCGDMSWPCR